MRASSETKALFVLCFSVKVPPALPVRIKMLIAYSFLRSEAEKLTIFLPPIENASYKSLPVYGLRFVFGGALQKALNYQMIPRCRAHRDLPDILYKTERTKLFASIDDLRDKAVLMTIYGAWLRISEVTHLRVQDIDSENMRLFIHHGKDQKARWTLCQKSGAPSRRRRRPPMPEIQDIFQDFGEAYCRSHGLSFAQSKAMSAIRRCRTAELGYHLDACESCGCVEISYNSCRNRHYPKCQTLAKERWIDGQKHNLLNVGYFHIVFTAPDDLRPVIYQNQSKLYALLFRAVAEILRELAADKKCLGAALGFTAILHTWGQNLMFHPHIYCIVQED